MTTDVIRTAPDLQAALDAAADRRGRTTIVLAPGTYLGPRVFPQFAQMDAEAHAFASKAFDTLTVPCTGFRLVGWHVPHGRIEFRAADATPTN